MLKIIALAIFLVSASYVFAEEYWSVGSYRGFDNANVEKMRIQVETELMVNINYDESHGLYRLLIQKTDNAKQRQMIEGAGITPWTIITAGEGVDMVEPSMAEDSSDPYFLVMGSFASVASARRLVEALRSAKVLDVMISQTTLEGNVNYRVISGPYAEKDHSVRQEIIDLGYRDAWWTTGVAIVTEPVPQIAESAQVSQTIGTVAESEPVREPVIKAAAGSAPDPVAKVVPKAVPRITSGPQTTPTESVLLRSDGAVQETTMEEILVTARKKSEALQDVPISVFVLSKDYLSTIFAGGDGIMALASRVPGLYAESLNGRGAPRLYIRGLGNVDFDLAASQPVSVVIDDVVMENVTLKSFPLFDLDHAEVIRGPQGTLFGRNTTAGVVKFDSRKPDFSPDAYLNVMGGQLYSWIAEGALGGTLIEDSLAMRVSLYSNNRKDWIGNGVTLERNVMGGHRDNAYRVQALVNLNDLWSVLIGIQDRELDGSSSFFRGNVFTTGQRGLNETYERGWVFYNEGDNNPQTIDSDISSLRVGYANGDFSFTSISAFQQANYSSKGDIDGGFTGGPGLIPFQAVTEDQSDVEQFTQEFRFIGTNRLLDWHVGTFYFDSDLDVTTTDGFFGSTTVNHTNSSWAAYLHLAFNVTKRLTATAGVRYTYDEKELKVKAQNVDSLALEVGAASIQDYEPVAVDDSQVSWETSLNYRISDNTSTFVRVAEGFRAQSIQGRDVAFEGLPSVANSETITSFEIGYKGQWDRARLNLTAFNYKIDDLQLSAVGGANNGNSLLNADSGVGRGFEFDLEWFITNNLMLSAGFAYADTEIKDAALVTAICGSGVCTVRDPVRDTPFGIVASIDGNPFQAAPQTTSNLGIRYSYPLRSGEVYFHTDWALQGNTQMALYDAVEFETSDQFEGGVRLGYINVEQGYEISFFGRNITNEDNIKGFIDFNNNTGFVNEPRLWAFEIKYGGTTL